MARIVLRGMNGEFQGRTWESSELLRIGRLDALEVVLDDSSVSRSHAEVRCTERGWRVRDLGSTNGTRLNGVRIGNGQWPLKRQDLLHFGDVALVVEALAATVAASTTPRIKTETSVNASSRTSLMSSGLYRFLGQFGDHASRGERCPSAFDLHRQLNISKRKLKLFACAVCRTESKHTWEESDHAVDAQRALELAEQYAEGLRSGDELDRALDRLDQRHELVHEACGNEFLRFIDGRQVRHMERLETDWWEEWEKNYQSKLNSPGGPPALGSMSDHVRPCWNDDDIRILEDIVGPVPFRPVTFDAIWLTPTVAALSQSAYEERTLPSGELDHARLAVLSDALEEAGCQDTDVLGHLRSPGRHFWGCWVLDLLLGKV